MTDDFSRRLFLAHAAALAASPAAAVAPGQSLPPRVRPADLYKRSIPKAEQLVARSGLSGSVSYVVADAQTGLRLEAGRAASALPPASVAKAITALYALDALGPQHRFSTRLVATSPVKAGVLEGDLVLQGGGDPTLSTDGLAALAAQIKAAGLREVRGSFRVSGAPVPLIATIDPGQPDHLGYSPAVSGIALNFNRVHFEWRRVGNRYRLVMDARTDRLRPAVSMAEVTIAVRDRPVFSYSASDGVDRWSVAQSALGRGGSRWLPVRMPEAYAGDVMRTLARSHGIVLGTPRVSRQVHTGTVLAQIESPDLRTILSDMLRFSTNLTAEMVGLAATGHSGTRVRDLAGSARVMSAWAEARFGANGIDLVDHSGLGDSSRMSVDAMAAVLVADYKARQLQQLLKGFGAAGQGADFPPLVQAKTGTLNFVSGLAGYARGRDGTDLAFAIFAADTARRSEIPRHARENPAGARDWGRTARTLQRALLARWGVLYGT